MRSAQKDEIGCQGGCRGSQGMERMDKHERKLDSNQKINFLNFDWQTTWHFQHDRTTTTTTYFRQHDLWAMTRWNHGYSNQCNNGWNLVQRPFPHVMAEQTSCRTQSQIAHRNKDRKDDRLHVIGVLPCGGVLNPADENRPRRWLKIISSFSKSNGLEIGNRWNLRFKHQNETLWRKMLMFETKISSICTSSKRSKFVSIWSPRKPWLRTTIPSRDAICSNKNWKR